MRACGQYCPLAKASELLTDRWTLLIVRDMLYGVCHFNDFERGLPGISRALLAARLRGLEACGIVERRVAGHARATSYHLTAAGRELQPVVDALVAWGARWAFGDPDPADLDPLLLVWWMRAGIHRDRLPPRRVVVQLDFSGVRSATYWLLLTRDDVSVCLHHPGFDVDLAVRADIAAFYKIWAGRIGFVEAARDGLVEIDGLPALARAFPAWLALSPLAGAIRESGVGSQESGVGSQKSEVRSRMRTIGGPTP